MSNKKKSGRSDWSTCQSCKLLITNKDWVQHASECRKRTDSHDGSFLSGIGSSQLGVDSDRKRYGFIDNGVLHAVVCLHADKGKHKLKYNLIIYFFKYLVPIVN